MGTYVDDVDSLGFSCPDDLDKEAYIKFWNNYVPILKRRDRRWRKVGLPRGKKLRRFVHKGVPSRLRPMIWMLGCPQIGMAKYDVNKQVVDAICLDLPRTFPDNKRLSNAAGNRIIGRILYRVAEYFPDIGYCQGFNYIAALIYLILNDENQTVRLMTHSIQQRRTYYTSDMSGIIVDIKVLRDLLRDRKMMPNALIRLMETDMEMMLSKWFLCWFLETLPMESVLRIWDCLFLEGDVVLFRVAVALIEASVPSLAKCRTTADVFEVFRDIGTSPLAVDCHHLLEVAFANDKVSITETKLNEYRHCYANCADMKPKSDIR
ncbi:unnamed protein product [Anisakis simplex]|uniref:Growth hormone-regulated TBC protein 6 (inferred by orthology to a C. elegans protein) n=1 Tax=Anisakis simplex TaxID=6269 RepID=A0A0M3JR74_ANISI|nr:unnamed protein product [Anisakis simplex]